MNNYYDGEYPFKERGYDSKVLKIKRTIVPAITAMIVAMVFIIACAGLGSVYFELLDIRNAI